MEYNIGDMIRITNSTNLLEYYIINKIGTIIGYYIAPDDNNYIDKDIIAVKFDKVNKDKILSEYKNPGYFWDCNGLDIDNSSRYFNINIISFEIIYNDVLDF